jgi:putative ABC transport system permease protein
MGYLDMGLWAYTIRELARRPGRSLLTLIGVAIGVATAVAAWSAGHAAQQGYRDLFDGLAGTAALEVFAPGEAPFDPGIAADLERVQGVRTTTPVVQGGASLRGQGGPIPVVLVGVGVGEECPGDGEAHLAPGLAHSAGLKTGDRARLWCPIGPAELVVVVRPGAGGDGPAEHVRVGTSLGMAQRLLGTGTKVNRLRLTLDEGADAEEVAEEVAQRLPPGLSVRVPTARAEVARGLRAAATQGLLGLTALAVAGAGVVVLNSVRVNLFARRAEVALIRTLGASVAQVEGIFLRQALLLGLAGSVIGVVTGSVIVLGINRVAGSIAGAPPAPARLGWEAAALGVGVGVGLALASSWLPARAFCRQPPLELFRPPSAAPGSTAGSWAGHAIASFGLALTLWVLTATAAGRLPIGWGRLLFPPALALLLGSLAGWTAPVFPLLVRACECPAGRAFGVAGVIAVRQLGRRPERTVRTTGVVFVAVTMAVGFGHTVLNTLADVRHWCDRAIPADFLVRGSTPDPGFLLTAALPENLADGLAALGGVEAVDTVTFIPTRVRGEPTLVLARTFPSDRPLPLDLRGGDAVAIRQGLAAGGAVLATGLARSVGAGPGDLVTLETPHGPRPIRVVATVTEYAGGGSALYIDRGTATRLFGPVAVHALLVTARAGQWDRAATALTGFCADRGLLLQTNEDLRRTVDDLTGALTATLWALLSLMFAVAGLGVWNAVAVNAREQARDVELLRAVGMARRRVHLTIGLQAMLVTLGGLLPGVAAGGFLAVILGHTLDGLWGYRVPFRFEFQLMVGVAGMTLLVGLIGGAYPSAARVSPTRSA